MNGPTGSGMTFGAGISTGRLHIDLARMQAGFDATLEQKFGAMRRALVVPEEVGDLQRMPAAALARRTPAIGAPLGQRPIS